MREPVYDRHGNYLGEAEIDRGCGCGCWPFTLCMIVCVICSICGNFTGG